MSHRQNAACIRGSGYKYLFSGKSRWRSSKDDNWDIRVTGTVCGTIVGRRRIDGAEVVVVKAGRRFYAATPPHVRRR